MPSMNAVVEDSEADGDESFGLSPVKDAYTDVAVIAASGDRIKLHQTVQDDDTPMHRALDDKFPTAANDMVDLTSSPAQVPASNAIMHAIASSHHSSHEINSDSEPIRPARASKISRKAATISNADEYAHADAENALFDGGIVPPPSKRLKKEAQSIRKTKSLSTLDSSSAVSKRNNDKPSTDPRLQRTNRVDRSVSESAHGKSKVDCSQASQTDPEDHAPPIKSPVAKPKPKSKSIDRSIRRVSATAATTIDEDNTDTKIPDPKPSVHTRPVRTARKPAKILDSSDDDVMQPNNSTRRTSITAKKSASTGPSTVKPIDTKRKGVPTRKTKSLSLMKEHSSDEDNDLEATSSEKMPLSRKQLKNKEEVSEPATAATNAVSVMEDLDSEIESVAGKERSKARAKVHDASDTDTASDNDDAFDSKSRPKIAKARKTKSTNAVATKSTAKGKAVSARKLKSVAMVSEHTSDDDEISAPIRAIKENPRNQSKKKTKIADDDLASEASEASVKTSPIAKVLPKSADGTGKRGRSAEETANTSSDDDEIFAPKSRRTATKARKSKSANAAPTKKQAKGKAAPARKSKSLAMVSDHTSDDDLAAPSESKEKNSRQQSKRQIEVLEDDEEADAAGPVKVGNGGSDENDKTSSDDEVFNAKQRRNATKSTKATKSKSTNTTTNKIQAMGKPVPTRKSKSLVTKDKETSDDDVAVPTKGSLVVSLKQSTRESKKMVISQESSHDPIPENTVVMTSLSQDTVQVTKIAALADQSARSTTASVPKRPRDILQEREGNTPIMPILQTQYLDPASSPADSEAEPSKKAKDTATPQKPQLSKLNNNAPSWLSPNNASRKRRMGLSKSKKIDPLHTYLGKT